ncbi:MAG TPA: type III-A CRISPR-associated protein Csm2 [Bryobacteraceae bacterium]|jgi:CRISPR type III-A-associated protein Csm2
MNDEVQAEATPVAAEPVAETPKEAPAQETAAAEAPPAESPKADTPKPESGKPEGGRQHNGPKREGQRGGGPQGGGPGGGGGGQRPLREDRGPRPGGGERRGPGGGGERRPEGGRPEGRSEGRRDDRREGGRPGGGRPFDGPPADIEIEKLIADSLYLDNQAHAVVARMRDMDPGTKSQLRRLYNAVRRAVRAPESERQHQFVMLRARLAYTIARHSLRSLDALERLLLQVTRKNDAKGYERFKDLFEAIVAYNE